MTILDSILKSRDITLPNKGPSSQTYGFSSGHVWMWELDCKKLSTKELMLLNCGVGEDSWESLGLQGDPTSPSYRRSVLGVHWKDDAEAETPKLWPPDAKSWLTGEKPWCWERLKAEGEEDEMVAWHHQLNGHKFEQALGVGDETSKPGMLQSVGSHRVSHTRLSDCTELNFLEVNLIIILKVIEYLTKRKASIIIMIYS